MSKHEYTRRDFLKSAILGMAVIAMPLCVSISSGASKSQAFTFVQICDTQLGMGGYEHDVETFKQAVVQIGTRFRGNLRRSCTHPQREVVCRLQEDQGGAQRALLLRVRKP